MPVIVRGTEVAAEPVTTGVTAQSLLTLNSTGSDHVLLDLLSLANGTEFTFTLNDEAFGWIQVLQGSGNLSDSEQELDPKFVTYLPLGYSGVFNAVNDSTKLLVATVPNAVRFDTNVADTPRAPLTTDWTHEPVLKSEHDERRRIYLATRSLTGTEAYRGEMIRYPAGTAAPEHHHEGAEHFQYVLAGSGTALLAGELSTLNTGDVLYNFENEIHAFRNDSDSEFVFVEFFVPGGCKTVWVPGADVCAWIPTGVDIMGRPPSRDISYHVHGEDNAI